MTTEQVLGSAISALGLLCLVIGFFLRAALAKIDTTAKEFGEFRVAAEKGFVSFDTFETHRKEMRENLNDKIFPALGTIKETLARIEAKSDIGATIAEAVKELVQEGREQRKGRRR